MPFTKWCGSWSMPFLLIEKYQWGQQYKIQKHARNDYEELFAIFVKELKEQFVVFLPLNLIAAHFLKPVLSFEREAATTCLANIVLCIFAHDVSFAVIHRLLHTPWLYRNVHKVHHEYYAPFALTAEHAHPVESMFGFFLPVLLAFLVIVLWRGALTMQTEMVYMTYLSYTSVQGHSGYSFPFFYEHLPLLGWVDGGATHHDLHHKLVKCNYGPRWLDALCGTLRNMDDEVARTQRKKSKAS